MVLDNVKRLCRERNVSLAKLERSAHIGNGVIARWDNPNRGPSAKNLKAVADYFGVTVDELLREDVQ